MVVVRSVAQDLLREAYLLSQLRHFNVVSFLGCTLAPPYHLARHPYPIPPFQPAPTHHAPDRQLASDP